MFHTNKELALHAQEAFYYSTAEPYLL